MIRKLNNILPCHVLLTIYRSLIRPYLDYGDVIYDQTENESVSSKIERVQHSTSLATTGAIRGTSQERYTKNQVWNHSGPERRYLRRMYYF